MTKTSSQRPAIFATQPTVLSMAAAMWIAGCLSPAPDLDEPDTRASDATAKLVPGIWSGECGGASDLSMPPHSTIVDYVATLQHSNDDYAELSPQHASAVADAAVALVHGYDFDTAAAALAGTPYEVRTLPLETSASGFCGPRPVEATTPYRPHWWCGPRGTKI